MIPNVEIFKEIMVELIRNKEINMEAQSPLTMFSVKINSCRQLFETYKKDRDMKFFYYDLTNYAQSRQYFDKLMEYQINYKEWETIIKKINLKESGLSDLFADCRDEKGLTEKWFLEAIESKLNKDKNRIKEFQSILEKCTDPSL